MSELINKFKCLRELNEEFKKNVKLFYVCNQYYSEKINIINIIVTNDDLVYAFEDEDNIEVLRELYRYQVQYEGQNKFIIKKLCHQRVIDFRNTSKYLFSRTFDGKVYYWKYCETKPQLIESLLNHNIIDICCSYEQVIALTDNGIVLTKNVFFGKRFRKI